MKKLASIILVLMMVLTLVPAFAEGEKVAVICDPVGNNLFLTQAVDVAKNLQETYGYTLDTFEDSPTMYQAVMNGSYDACIEDYNVICWAIETEDMALSVVGDILNPGQYGFAVKKGNCPELIEMFNAGLANIKASGVYDELLAKYGY